MASSATAPASGEPTHGASSATDNRHGHSDNVHGTRPRRRGRVLKVVGSVVAGLLVLAVAALVVLGYGAKLVDFHRAQLSNSVKGGFQQLSFTDPTHGNVTVKYNPYVPKDYDYSSSSRSPRPS